MRVLQRVRVEVHTISRFRRMTSRSEVFGILASKSRVRMDSGDMKKRISARTLVQPQVGPPCTSQ